MILSTIVRKKRVDRNVDVVRCSATLSPAGLSGKFDAPVAGISHHRRLRRGYGTERRKHQRDKPGGKRLHIPVQWTRYIQAPSQ